MSKQPVSPVLKIVQRRLGLLLPMSLASFLACNDLLEVSLPGQVPVEALDDSAMAETLVLGAIGDFECALSHYAGMSAAITDEFIGATTRQPMFDLDWRRIHSNHPDLLVTSCESFNAFGLYTPVQTARFQAEDIFRRIESFNDVEVANRTQKLATLASYAGYGYILLGEGFCEMSIDEGPVIPRAEVFRIAKERFTMAIELAESSQLGDILNMARVGRARANQNLGELTAAAEDARLVPEGFVMLATRSADVRRRYNAVADAMNERHFSIDPSFRDLDFEGVPDPRVQVVETGQTGIDGLTPLWRALKYVDVADALPIATWDEAQLIIAEAEGGQAAVEAINRLHAKVGLPPFDSSDPSEIRAQVLEERRRVLFLDGHRLGDLLRYDLLFPSGTYKGVAYGETTCLPLPDVERR